MSKYEYERDHEKRIIKGNWSDYYICDKFNSTSFISNVFDIYISSDMQDNEMFHVKSEKLNLNYQLGGYTVDEVKKNVLRRIIKTVREIENEIIISLLED